MKASRRNLLKAGLAAGSLFAPLPFAWVWSQQSDGALKLLRAPKVALVIGNGKYKDAPELKNAPNDARAIAAALKGAGFAVTMLLETGREALVGAIRDYVNGMEKQKAVGLFYFAGHGVQLDWRNYMLPVDAVIDRIEDVAKQSVDIVRLMEGLTKAANPMNMIILDACRENPFGTAKPVAQKGLSQMDAPTHTILAYATSPGNVASDGDGVNGLYTENLLREIKVPEAKIEDVFKRVRLGVRVKSRGAQIPWESTSLEDDFYFLPPAQLHKRSEAEKEKEFKEEAALWEKARQAKEPGLIEEYLQRYPNGNFSELAQLQLDRALARLNEKRIVVASQEGNPFTKGSATANTRFKPGDSYSYRFSDFFSRAEQGRFTATVAKISDTEVQYSNGRVTDLLGNVSVTNDGRRLTSYQNFPVEYAVGKRWHSRYTSVSRDGAVTFTAEIDFHISGRERITVPAGSFNAFRIEGEGRIWNFNSTRHMRQKFWLAPDQLRAAPAQEEVFTDSRGVRSIAYRQELLAFSES